MQQLRLSVLSSSVLVLVISSKSDTSFAWGRVGHQTVATVASRMMAVSPGFWAANADNMGMLTNVPDNTWKRGRNGQFEKPTHWFQPDSYFTHPDQFGQFPKVYTEAVTRYGAEMVTENGTAPWRIKQLYDLGVAALRRHDFASGLEMAGTMSHYIGDLAQPLHVTKNYDGNETGNPGIHKFFESDNLERADRESLTTEVTNRARALLANRNFRNDFEGSIVDAIFKEIDRSYAFQKQVNDNDIRLGRSGRGSEAQLEIAKGRMADGAATLAMILALMSEDAGLGENGVTVAVDVPAWWPPDFAPIAPGSILAAEAFGNFIQADDCNDSDHTH